MPTPPSRCPSPGCAHHSDPPEGFCRKRGFYKPKGVARPVQRWQCKGCGATFSARTESDVRRQRKPGINAKLMGLLCSGATLRRSARLLDVAYSTVRRRASWLARRAKAAHEAALADPVASDLLTEHVQFDELRSFEHSRAKQLTIGLAVRAKTGKIISVQVGRIPTSGRLASKGRTKYAWTKDETPTVLRRTFSDVAKCITPLGTVSTDGWPKYQPIIRTMLRPLRLSHNVVYSRVAAKGGFDQLFTLNHLCAKIRNDLSCMARKTWTTTKKMEKLQERLWLYTAWVNGYKI